MEESGVNEIQTECGRRRRYVRSPICLWGNVVTFTKDMLSLQATLFFMPSFTDTIVIVLIRKNSSSGSYDFFYLPPTQVCIGCCVPKSEFESEGGMLQMEELEHG